jgi:hypothetical protein
MPPDPNLPALAHTQAAQSGIEAVLLLRGRGAGGKSGKNERMPLTRCGGGRKWRPGGGYPAMRLLGQRHHFAFAALRLPLAPGRCAEVKPSEHL